MLTPARSGLARSGVTRSGYPILLGVRVPLYALSGVARSGATRSGYHSGQVFMTIGGVHVATGYSGTGRVPFESLSITDVLNEEPTTGQCTAIGFDPVEGQDVVITLGSKNNLVREFGGNIIRRRQFPLTDDEDNPDTDAYDLALIDYTWGLNKFIVSGYYTGSATTIAESLIAEYAPGYTAQIEQGLPTVDGGITFTNQKLPNCLTQLFKRVGANWLCDYHKVVRGFTQGVGGTQPTLLNAVHPTLRGFSASRDLSQVITRVHVEGGGVIAFATVLPGEISIPINGDPAWYEAPGVVVSGPQRISYTGVDVGGGGGLVGPGAFPSSLISLSLASGSGIESGAHGYAATFVTALGESLPSPVASITVGAVSAPASAPTAGTPTVGSGPDPGSHDYAVTFVTAGGETTPSPIATRATALTPAPTVAPTPGTATPGGSVDPGLHDYAVSFVTSVGETTPSPISGAASTGVTPAPASAPTPGTPTAGGSVDQGSHDYAVSFVTSVGETTPGPISVAVSPVVESSVPAVSFDAFNLTSIWNPGDLVFFIVTTNSGGGEIVVGRTHVITLMDAGGGSVYRPILTNVPTGTGRRLYRNVNGVWRFAENITVGSGSTITFTNFTGTFGAPADTAPYAGFRTIPLTGIPTGGTGVTSRNLYRRFNGAGDFKLVTTIANNIATAYTDTSANSSLGAVAPATNTATLNTIPLTGIPLGNADVTARNLYRRSGGAGLKLLTTLANNTATAYTDTTANASLGVAPPAVSTAYAQRIPLTNIPTGPALVTQRKIYRTAAGGSQLKLAHTIANNLHTSWDDNVPDSGLGANAPMVNTATANQVALSGIPVGASAVTSRKLYRTVAGGSQLKFLATIADNTTSTHTDSAADASLGANVPVVDASGLTQPEGQVPAGSTSIVVAGTGPFRAAGGWAVIGNGEQVIRYFGKTGAALTGIPTSGPGSIEAAIGYNSTITAAPMLTGIPTSGPGSIRYPILKGDDINIFVTSEDTAAQAAMAALVGGDGIVEEYIQDRRLARSEAQARGMALLALRSRVEVGISYTCRDINTSAGKTIQVNLGPPFNLQGVEFLIQSVTQTFQLTRPTTPPLYRVEASSTRLTFEQLLMMVRN